MHACLNALISSDVFSYRVGSSPCPVESSSIVAIDTAFSIVWAPSFDLGDVLDKEDAMTRNVVRSNRMTSVALQVSAKILKCLDKRVALGISVCTIRLQAYFAVQSVRDGKEIL